MSERKRLCEIDPVLKKLNAEYDAQGMEIYPEYARTGMTARQLRRELMKRAPYHLRIEDLRRRGLIPYDWVSTADEGVIHGLVWEQLEQIIMASPEDVELDVVAVRTVEDILEAVASGEMSPETAELLAKIVRVGAEADLVNEIQRIRAGQGK